MISGNVTLRILAPHIFAGKPEGTSENLKPFQAPGFGNQLTYQDPQYVHLEPPDGLRLRRELDLCDTISYLIIKFNGARNVQMFWLRHIVKILKSEPGSSRILSKDDWRLY